MCFYWSGIALLYSHWFRYAVYNNLGVPSVLYYHYSAPSVPIGQDELYCILFGLDTAVYDNVACMMNLHCNYKSSYVSIGHLDLLWSHWFRYTVYAKPSVQCSALP
jgi:hypothetical protein